MSAMDTGLLNAASVDVTPSVDSGVDSGNTGAENTEVESGAEQGTELEGAEAEGSETDEGAEGEQGTEGKDNAAGTQKDALDKDTKSPVQIRKQLKTWRDGADSNTPEGKQARAVVKQLHDSYERWEAAKTLFPKGYGEMKTASEFIKANGGSVQAAQATLDAVRAVDAKLFGAADDPKQATSLVEDIISDLKDEGKEAALGNLSNAFVTALEKADSKAWTGLAIGMIARGITESNAVGALNAAWDHLQNGNVEKAKAALRGMGKWFSDVLKQSEEQKNPKIDPERQKFEAEKQEFFKKQRSGANAEIGLASNKADNDALGKELSPFLKMPFFKGFTRENLKPLALQIQLNLREELKADKIYQAHMKSLWGAKEPSKEDILKYHGSKVNDIARRIVRSTVERMYPGYTKGGTAAGRVTAQAAKREAENKSVQSGKPIYIVSKPKELIRTNLTIGSKTYTPSDLTMMEIAGRGFIKSANGYKLITWRKA